MTTQIIKPNPKCQKCGGYGTVSGGSVPYGSTNVNLPDEFCDCIIDQIEINPYREFAADLIVWLFVRSAIPAAIRERALSVAAQLQNQSLDIQVDLSDAPAHRDWNEPDEPWDLREGMRAHDVPVIHREKCAGPQLCAHNQEFTDCNACMIASDFAYDAARERGRF